MDNAASACGPVKGFVGHAAEWDLVALWDRSARVFSLTLVPNSFYCLPSLASFRFHALFYSLSLLSQASHFVVRSIVLAQEFLADLCTPEAHGAGACVACVCEV